MVEGVGWHPMVLAVIRLGIRQYRDDIANSYLLSSERRKAVLAGAFQG
jgi:hypothetical protein